MTRRNPPPPALTQLAWLIFLGTLVMTYLTVAKELVLYQNERTGWPVLVYKIATRHYYPLLACNFVAICAIALQHYRGRHGMFVVGAAFLVFLINVAMFSSNNILNWLEGQPLHRVHQGIGR